jgi:hypothetical protein
VHDVSQVETHAGFDGGLRVIGILVSINLCQTLRVQLFNVLQVAQLILVSLVGEVNAAVVEMTREWHVQWIGPRVDTIAIQVLVRVSACLDQHVNNLQALRLGCVALIPNAIISRSPERLNAFDGGGIRISTVLE